MLLDFNQIAKDRATYDATDESRDTISAQEEIGDTSRLVKAYVENENFKEDAITNDMWSMLQKDLPLSFMETEDIPIVMLMFNIMKHDHIMGLHRSNIDAEKRQQLNQIRSLAYIRTRRAIGFKEHNRINERTSQTTSTQVRMVGDVNKKTGFFDSIAAKGRKLI